MLKYANKSFMTFVVGFIALLSLSFFVMIAASYFESRGEEMGPASTQATPSSSL